MKISATNFTRLARTFGGAGRGVVMTDPSGEVMIPPVTQPVFEACLPIPDRLANPGPIVGESFLTSAALAVATGGGDQTAALITLARGIWRIRIYLSAITYGAANGVAGAGVFSVQVVDPSTAGIRDVIFFPGKQAAGVGMTDTADFTIHLPTDGWAWTLFVNDPITVSAVARAQASLYACRLL